MDDLGQGAKLVQEALLNSLREVPYFSWCTVTANTGTSAEGAEVMSLFAPSFQCVLAFSMVEASSVVHSVLSTRSLHVICIWCWQAPTPRRWRWCSHWWQASHSQPSFWLWSCHEWNHTGILCSWAQWRDNNIHLSWVKNNSEKNLEAS